MASSVWCQSPFCTLSFGSTHGLLTLPWDGFPCLCLQLLSHCVYLHGRLRVLYRDKVQFEKDFFSFFATSWVQQLIIHVAPANITQEQKCRTYHPENLADVGVEGWEADLFRYTFPRGLLFEALGVTFSGKARCSEQIRWTHHLSVSSRKSLTGHNHVCHLQALPKKLINEQTRQPTLNTNIRFLPSSNCVKAPIYPNRLISSQVILLEYQVERLLEKEACNGPANF